MCLRKQLLTYCAFKHRRVRYAGLKSLVIAMKIYFEQFVIE